MRNKIQADTLVCQLYITGVIQLHNKNPINIDTIK